MNASIAVFACFILSLGSAAAAEEPVKPNFEAANVVLWNGTIYPLASQGSTSTVESVVIRGDRIVFTGSKEDAKKYVGNSTRVVDLGRRVVIPGFTDAHTHPLAGALMNATCDLSEATQPDAIRRSLVKYANANPDKSWIVAMNVWEPALLNLPSYRKMLDELIPNRPVVLIVTSGHCVWLNSKALELAKITADTPDPSKGRIDREPNSREPNGVLHEEAIQPILESIPPPSEAERVKGLKESLREANSYGIVNLIDARVEEPDIVTYRSLAEAGELTAHVSLAAYVDIPRGLASLKPALDLIRKYRGKGKLPEDLTLDQVKIYLDGTVEGKTAAMLDRYVGDKHDSLGLTDPETVKAVFAALDKEGLQIQVHAIGDRAIRMALDGFEHARKVNGIRDARHQIAHLHVVHPDDVSRFKSLDVVANFQACWADGDSEYITKINFGLLGPDRAEWQYPIGSVARTGATLVFGSDWPVSTMDPLRAIQIAITRRQPDGVERPPWTAQHLIELQSVMEGFTRNGAWVTFREKESGTLEPGKVADLVVLRSDIFKISKFDILQKAKVEKTMFRGKFVFEKE